MIEFNRRYLVFCTTTEGELVSAEMVPDQIALAVNHFGSSFIVWMMQETTEKKIQNVWVPLDIFQKVSQQYRIGERVPILCDDCLDTYVLTSAQLKDGRWVKIGLTLGSCLDYLAASAGTSVMLNYRTKVNLGDDIGFVSFFIDPTVAAILEGRKKFCHHLG